MKRALTAVLLGAIVIAGCGDDDEPSSASQGADSSIADESPDSATPATETVTPTTAATATTATATSDAATTVPATTAAPVSTTENEGRAAAALLTPADLPGWTQTPDDDDDSDFEFTGPECAGLEQLDDLPGMDDDADTTLVTPDGKVEVNEGVTVGDPANLQTAFDLFADPSTANCLTAVFTAILTQPGQAPEGVTITGVQFAQAPLAAGEQAVSYVATLTFTGNESGVSAPLGIRFDAVKSGGAIALLVTTTGPGAAPVDPAALAATAGTKLASIG
jgi:hypothetical protein